MPSFSAKCARHQQRPRKARQRRVAILAYPGVTLLDIAGPAQVFAALAQEPVDRSEHYQLCYFSACGGSITTDVGMNIDTIAFADLHPGDIDTLIITGGPGVWQVKSEAALLDWITRATPAVRRVASVCLGAFILGWTGLLDGRRAVTHWRQCDRLARMFPNIHVEPNAIFVKDGSVWTSAGVSAGIDLALAMLEEDFGRTTALSIARRLVVFLKRSGGQSQFSTILQAQSSDLDGRFSALHTWMAENLASDLRVDRLAAQAGMSPRSFARAYASRTGTTPAERVEALRVETARLLLQDGCGKPVAEVAHRSGFGDDERMRRAFIRRLGISPSEYRNRFSN